MVRSAASRVSNHEGVTLILRDATKRSLLQDEDRYTATNSATPATISAMPESSRADSGCLNE
jgi:hypothetical protein